jgi:hypothetical protein
MNSYNGFSPRQRNRALRWLHKQYAAGRRTRPTQCDACGQTRGIVEHHSEDYSEPFGDHIAAFALCYRCHMMVHCRFRYPPAWRRYREAVAAGRTFEPIYARNFPEFARQLRGQDIPFTERAPPGRTVLDAIDESGGSGGTGPTASAADDNPAWEFPLFTEGAPEP